MAVATGVIACDGAYETVQGFHGRIRLVASRWRMLRTIDDLSAEVPMGGSRTFPASRIATVDTDYVDVHFNADCGPPILWHNRPSFTDLPWTGSRDKARIGIAEIAEPHLTYPKNSRHMCDFYSTGTGAFFVSEKLHFSIEEFDHGSIEARQVRVKARDKEIPFWMVMPNRVFETVDTELTDIKIFDEKFADQWIRSVKFPGNVFIRKDAARGAHNFSDVDLPNRWIWTKDLVEFVKSQSVCGIYTGLPGAVVGEVDRF